MRGKRLAAMLSAVGAVVGMTIAVAPHAVADAVPACWSSGCSQKDPGKEGCLPTAYTPVSVTWVAYDTVNGPAYAYIELRYSVDCGAAWARVNLTDPSHMMKSVSFFVRNTKGVVQPYVALAGVSSWTDMVDDAGSSINAQACVGTASKPIYCTSWW
jgi:hypothetical protein